MSQVADRVAKRVVVRRWIEGLRKSVLWAVVVALVLGWLSMVWWGGVAVLVGWVVLVGLWARRQRPDQFAALSYWDDQAGRKDEFASAWALDGEGIAEQLHRERVEARLPQASSQLAKDLPLGLGWKDGAGVFGAIWVVMMSGWLLTRGEIDRMVEGGMSVEMQTAAKGEGVRIAGQDELEFDEEVLTEEERAEIAKLQEEVKAMGSGLGESADASAREVLKALEAKAREAEELAGQLSEGGDEWASAAMVAELRRHLDTETFGGGVEEKGAAVVAVEARGMAESLGSKGLTREVEDRYRETFELVVSAAGEDKGGMVGEVVARVSELLTGREPGMAADAMTALADQMERVEQREEASDELEKLAASLRQSGSEITGQGGAESQAMESLAEDAGSSSLGAMPQVAMAPPGFGNRELGNPQGQAEGTPPLSALVPGTGDSSGKPNQGQDQAPMMMAPVPGEIGEPEGAISVAVTAKPGEGQGMAGGDRAGVGTAELEGEATAPQGASNDKVVAAAQGSDGASTVRAVQGGAGEEDAARSANELAVDFIRVEEAALDEAQLPLSRRRQVLRYFTGLRESFEKELSNKGEE